MGHYKENHPYSFNSNGMKKSQTKITTTAIISKGSWSSFEDERLRNLVGQHSARYTNQQIPWKVIEISMKNRTAKQCRERWLNHLNDSINKSPLTEDEERLILQMRQYQPNISYVQIAKKMPGRTPLIIKNFIYREKAKAKKSASRVQKRMSITTVLNPKI